MHVPIVAASPSLENDTRVRGFTLIELLVVIAIIAILAVVVVLTLNPAEMMREARDSNRLSDLATLQSAINLYSTDAAVGAASSTLGNQNIVYVSLPDPTLTGNQTSTCASLNLPALPAGDTYQCSSPNAYRTTNGSGWLPVNLASLAMSNILSSLPVDPTNQSSTRLYYTYTTNGTQYEITAPMESSKYQLGGSNDVIANDGSPLATVYAKGTNLTLEPLDYGDPTLVGYWPLDEGSGTVAYDDSGNNATGSWNGTQVGTSGYYSPGFNQIWAGAFDGSSTLIYLNGAPAGSSNGITVVAWVKKAIGNYGEAVRCGNSYFLDFENGPTTLRFGVNGQWGMSSGGYPDDGQFHMITGTYDGASAKQYMDGILLGQEAYSWSMVSCANPTIGYAGGGTNYIQGLVQGVRIYDRALSPAEIAALYDAEK